MRGEYDLSNAVRGRHAERYAAGVAVTIHDDGGSSDERSNLVELEPDVQAVFPAFVSVNAALRLLIETAEKAQGLKTASQLRLWVGQRCRRLS